MNLVFDKDKATLDNVIRPLGWLADGTKSSVGSIVSFPSIPHRKEFSEASQCIINDGFFMNGNISSRKVETPMIYGSILEVFGMICLLINIWLTQGHIA
ncbi:hypothetical protein [Photobacterium sp. 1_MG-2023]|uniref:hypothetical protein n=1 Tax=Photobacterium sp. 1_MG-2023 TaxID=3062646 RepID=UPI0026E2C081|nr:hypothetical protein [Photobacterium sp. 1_MG-2023]MDO6708976.1 hypothetical protein [Photobacterium sp. 1_MG-2023]